VEGFPDEAAAILQQRLNLAEDVKRQLATIEGRQLDSLDEFQGYRGAQSEEEQATQHQLRSVLSRYYTPMPISAR